MQKLLATQIASISELKKNPSKLIHDAHGPIAILNHNTTTAYLLSAKIFEQLMELIEDNDLQEIVALRLSDNINDFVKVDIDDEND